MGRYKDCVFGKIPRLLLNQRFKRGDIQNDTKGRIELRRLCGTVPL